MLTTITNTLFGLLGAASGIYLYITGKRQGYQEGYDKANACNMASNNMFQEMKELLNTMGNMVDDEEDESASTKEPTPPSPTKQN